MSPDEPPPMDSRDPIVLAAAAHYAQLEELEFCSVEEAAGLLRSVHGVGEWTEGDLTCEVFFEDGETVFELLPPPVAPLNVVVDVDGERSEAEEHSGFGRFSIAGEHSLFDVRAVAADSVVATLREARTRPPGGARRAPSLPVTRADRIIAFDVHLRPLAATAAQAAAPRTDRATWVEIDLPDEFAHVAMIGPVVRVRRSSRSLVVRVRSESGASPPAVDIRAGADAVLASGPRPAGDDWYDFEVDLNSQPELEGDFVELAVIA